MKISSEAVQIAKRLHFKFGKHYYYATLFLPRQARRATHILYAYFRIADEYVDAPGVDPASALERFRAATLKALNDKDEAVLTDLPVDNRAIILAMREVMRFYSIPTQDLEAFLDSMEMDLTVTRYKTRKDVEHYMYGSAAVVGLMMARVIGFRGDALEYAKKLGYAMQLTNFLRDTREDYIERGRIYLPLQRLEQYGVREEELAGNSGATAAWKQFCTDEVAYIRSLYAEAEKGIALLEPRGRFAVRAASRLYAGILTDIERHDYDVFSKKRGASTLKKLFILAKTFFL